MTAKNIIAKIAKFLEWKFNSDKSELGYDMRWNKNHTSFYIYKQASDGRPISYATLRISDHSPKLDNYMKPKETGFNYPSEHHGYNLSVEFYDPNHPFEFVNKIKNSYNFDVDRYMYPAHRLTEDDIREILVNAIYFIQNPESKFDDPLANKKGKKAVFKKGIALRGQVAFPLPDKDVYDGPMNYWKVVYDRQQESASNTFEYMFVTFESGIDLRTEVTKLIREESEKRMMYEFVMDRVSREIRNILK